MELEAAHGAALADLAAGGPLSHRFTQCLGCCCCGGAAGVGTARWIWLLPVLLLVLPGAAGGVAWIPELLQLPARAIVPEAIWGRPIWPLANGPWRPPAWGNGRWPSAWWLIALGWAGAAAFSLCIPERAGVWHGHPHNLPLELAISFGLPAALMLVGLALWLLVRLLQRGMFGPIPLSGVGGQRL